ncbi:MAG: hypothetical protein ACE14V_00180 [bacterium]
MIILNIIIAIISLAAGIISIISFLRDKIKFKISLIVISLLFSSISIGFIFWYEHKNSVEKIKIEAHNTLIKDAQIVADSIIISGVEEAGDYLGYLSQISGFYQRHNDIYKTEADNMQKEYKKWSDIIRNKKIVYSSDWADLKGLVDSSKNHLRQIVEKG